MSFKPIPIPEIRVVEVTGPYGQFAAEPMMKGFATTLGNALRRVLLSSLPGAAVTWVKIAGISHEFSTVPHVKEDVIGLLLNIKSLRLRPVSGKSGKLFLEIEGEGEVHAADIAPSSDFEIVNPDLHVAALGSSEAKLSMELNVEMGRGYLPAGSTNNLDEGAIPVDAIFSPIRQVSYRAEEIPGTEPTGQEKLVLEVWTDNTISPEDAVSLGADVLMKQLSSFRDFHKAPREAQEKLPPGLSIPVELQDMPIDALGLTTRTLNSLRRGGIATVKELIFRSVTKKALPDLRQFGEKAKEEVTEKLKTKLNIDISQLLAGEGTAEGETASDDSQAPSSLSPEQTEEEQGIS